MPDASSDCVYDQLAALRTELVEQACALERQGRLDAADVAIALSHRLGELCEPDRSAAGGVDRP